MISVQYHTAASADVGTHTQRLLDHGATLRTLLTGELWYHGNDRDIMHRSIGFHLGQELSPSGIMNALREMVVLDHVADLQVFIGNQIVRCD